MVGGQPPAKPDGTPADPKPTAPVSVVPEKYDLKMPEGSLLDAAYSEKVVSEYKKLGFSQEQAQAALSRESQAVSEYVNQLKPGGEKWIQQESEWRTKVKTDPEIGGSDQKMAESAEFGNRALKEFFSPEIAQFLQQTGFGSHPELVRGLAKIGRKMANDQVVTGTVSTQPKSAAQILYGNTK